MTELNRSLKGQEIEQLNELLIWTIYAFWYLNKENMEAALFLCTKRHSLQTVEEKIKKFDQLLAIDEDDFFIMKNNGWEEFFRASKRYKQGFDTEVDNDPKITMTITVDRVPRSKVRKWIWSINKEVVLEDFKFAASLADIEPIDQTRLISANSTEAHLTLARRCLEVLLEPQPETETLEPYALNHLPAHLDKLREQENLELLEPSEREDILRDLVGLLQYPECIADHLSDRFFLHTWWLDEDALGAVSAWLKGEHAGHLDRISRKWLKHANSNTSLFALREMAVMVARHWLCLEEWEAHLPFQWLDYYVERLAESQGDIQDGASGNEDSIEKAGVQSDKGDDMAVQERVTRAMRWAENAGQVTRSALTHKRIGDTYLQRNQPQLAIESYNIGKTHPDCSWTILAKIADAYAQNDQKITAIQESESLISRLRDTTNKADVETKGLINSLFKCARWQAELKHTTDAISKLAEATKLDPCHLQSNFELFKIFMDTHDNTEALRQLDAMSNRLVEDDVSVLDSLLFEMANSNDSDECLETMFQAAANPPMSKTISESLQKALQRAEVNGQTSKQTSLLLCFGKVLARHSTEEDHLDQAIRQWSMCRELGWKSQEWYDWTLALHATRYLFNCDFSAFRSGRLKPEEPGTVYQNLESWAANAPSTWHGSCLRQLLGSFHCRYGDRLEARRVLSNDLQNSLDLLSDDDPDNDQQGYSGIANVMLHTGDDLNALSGLSLCGPSARLSLCCDGCDVGITLEDTVWSCKICDDVDYHTGCLEKLKQGKQTPLVCSPDHEWLRLPNWQDESKLTGDGVRIGGELQNDERVGDKVIPVKEWLNKIREDWGFSTPEPVQGNEGQDQPTA